MKFEIRHAFEAPIDRVEQTMLSKDLLGYILEHHKMMLEAELLDIVEDSATVRRKVRYRPKPLIESIGPKKVPPEWMAWIEESSFDRTRHLLRFDNRPTVERIRNLLENHGTVELIAEGPRRTQRIIKGELRVRVMLLGAIAERIIYKRAHELLDDVLHRACDGQLSGPTDDSRDPPRDVRSHSSSPP